MEHFRAAAIPLVLSCIDRINRNDLDGIAELLAHDYELRVFDAPPEVGRQRGIDGWRGYCEAYPRYLIYPTRIAEDGNGSVAVLGYTTGSHLGLPDEEERQLTLIWVATVAQGRVRRWMLIEDTPPNRVRFGLE